MTQHDSWAVLDLGSVLDLPPFRAAGYEILTPRPDLHRPVRWAHALETAAPAAMLQGDELVLSTLTLFTENLPDLRERLGIHLNELSEAGAAGLAVEVLPDRPHLLAALREVTGATAESSRIDLPVILFGRFVRFVEMTEHLHRTLILREADVDEYRPEAADPLFELTSLLFHRLARDDADASEESLAEARALGMPRGDFFAPFLCRFDDQETSSEGHRQTLARTLRDSATELRSPILVGGREDHEVAGIVSGGRTEDLAGRVRRLIERAQSLLRSQHRWRLLPPFSVGVGRTVGDLRDAAGRFAEAAEVAAFAAVLERHSESRRARASGSAVPQCWMSQDIGLRAFLARIAGWESAESYVKLQLSAVPPSELQAVTALVRGLVEQRASKSELAATLGISRPTLYQRLSRLETMLGGPADGERLTGLYVALLLRDFSPVRTT